MTVEFNYKLGRTVLDT